MMSGRRGDGAAANTVLMPGPQPPGAALTNQSYARGESAGILQSCV